MDRMFKFPELPDRWLVLRLSRKDPRGFNVKAWIVESETQTVHKLEKWIPAKPHLVDAVVSIHQQSMIWLDCNHHGSDIALPSRPARKGLVGPFNYCVMGWYSRKEKDPLTPSQRQQEASGWLYWNRSDGR